jgi:hypothetical protein
MTNTPEDENDEFAPKGTSGAGDRGSDHPSPNLQANTGSPAEVEIADAPYFEVGYGKPPTASRFKPGQSGNPKGRKKGVRNIKTFLNEELNRRQWITVDGKRRLLNKREIAVLYQIARAHKGKTMRRSPVFKPGTKLIREWQGKIHEVLALEDGQFAWAGKTCRSLTVIARQITGAHWSGPRFFGLKAGKGTTGD